jgi:iron complex transport system substrate-binding protein
MGPGLLEGVYEACLAWELRDAGLIVERQKAVDLTYQDLLIPAAFRVDLVIGDTDGNRIIAELKSHANLPSVFHAQLISYLRFMNLPIGVLVNFHPLLLKDGISRVLNSGWKPA